MADEPIIKIELEEGLDEKLQLPESVIEDIKTALFSKLGLDPSSGFSDESASDQHKQALARAEDVINEMNDEGMRILEAYRPMVKTLAGVAAKDGVTVKEMREALRDVAQSHIGGHYAMTLRRMSRKWLDAFFRLNEEQKAQATQEAGGNDGLRVLIDNAEFDLNFRMALDNAYFAGKYGVNPSDGK